MKNPLTPAGIEPATYRFVAQNLNQCTDNIICAKFTWIRSVHMLCGFITIQVGGGGGVSTGRTVRHCAEYSSRFVSLSPALECFGSILDSRAV